MTVLTASATGGASVTVGPSPSRSTASIWYTRRVSISHTQCHSDNSL